MCHKLLNNPDFNFFYPKINRINSRKKLIDKSGIYLYFYRMELLYIGISTNLYIRPFNHINKGGCLEFQEIDILAGYFLSIDLAKRIETNIIKIYNPSFNIKENPIYNTK